DLAVSGERKNDDAVADVAQARGGAIELDLPGPRRRGDHVRLEPIPRVEVGHQDLLPFDQPDFFHEGAVDHDAALVMHVHAGHCGLVNLGFHENEFHAGRWTSLWRLSYAF